MTFRMCRGAPEAFPSSESRCADMGARQGLRFQLDSIDVLWRPTPLTAWQLQEARNRLSEVVDRANESGVQVITRRGKEVAVIMSWDDYRRGYGRQGDLVDFLIRSPLAGSGIAIERDRTPIRPQPEL